MIGLLRSYFALVFVGLILTRAPAVSCSYKNLILPTLLNNSKSVFFTLPIGIAICINSYKTSPIEHCTSLAKFRPSCVPTHLRVTYTLPYYIYKNSDVNKLKYPKPMSPMCVFSIPPHMPSDLKKVLGRQS